MSKKFVKFNKKNILIIIYLFILSFGLVYFYKLSDRIHEISTTYQFKETEDIVSVVVFSNDKDTYLTEDNISKIYTSELMGYFLVGVKDGYRLSSVSLDGRYFDIYNPEVDNSVKIVKERGGYLKISPLYIIDPSNHELQVEILDDRGKKIKHIYKFTFIYSDNFSNMERSRSFWIKPQITAHPYSPDLKWEIFDNKLQGISLSPESNFSKFVSIMFFRRLGGDIDTSFDIEITSLNTSLAIYFLESKTSFVIGDGSNKVLTYKYDNKTFPLPFNLELNNRYHCEINRTGLKYTLTISSINNPKINKSVSFNVNEVATLDTIGLSLWGSSNGVKIINTSVWGQK